MVFNALAQSRRIDPRELRDDISRGFLFFEMPFSLDRPPHLDIGPKQPVFHGKMDECLHSPFRFFSFFSSERDAAEYGLAAIGKKFALPFSRRWNRFDHDELFAALGTSFRMRVSLFLAVFLPGQELRLLHRQLPEHLPAGIQPDLVGRPVQAPIMDALDVGHRNMEQVTLNKPVDRQRHLAFLVGFLAVDPVGEHDFLAVAFENPVIGDRPAAQIPGQIHRHAPATCVAFPEIDVPFDLAAQLVFKIAPLLHVQAVGQPDFSLLDGGIDMGQEFAAVLDHDRLEGQQGVASLGFAPDAVLTQCPADDEAMDMNVGKERLTPGMQTRDDPGCPADVLLVLDEVEQGIANRLKENPGHGLDVHQPDLVEFMGYREYDMIMIRTEQPGLLLLQPSLDKDIGALRA